ncbi:unnamed protein product, partial [Polarella glacialis]
GTSITALKESLVKCEISQEAAKANVSAAKAQVAEIERHCSEKGDCSEELKVFLQAGTKELTEKLDLFISRVAKSSTALVKLRAATKIKDRAELLTLGADVRSALRKHSQKLGKKGEELFTGDLSEADFVAFIGTCEEKAESLTKENLARYFAENADAETQKLSKDTLLRLVMVYYKVTAQTAITSTLSIKEATTVRKIEIGEVWASDDVAERDDAAEVTR